MNTRLSQQSLQQDFQQKIQQKAEREWKSSAAIRRQYPTFVFYWHEQYERVYNIQQHKKTGSITTLVQHINSTIH